MLTRSEARARMLALIEQPDPQWPDRPQIRVLDDLTLELPDAWVFFWDVPGHMVAGNGPVLVRRETGELVRLGSAYPVDWYLTNFARTGDPYRAS